MMGLRTSISIALVTGVIAAGAAVPALAATDSPDGQTGPRPAEQHGMNGQDNMTRMLEQMMQNMPDMNRMHEQMMQNMPKTAT